MLGFWPDDVRGEQRLIFTSVDIVGVTLEE